MSKELMRNLKGKKKAHEMWKNGLTTWEEYRNVARACRDATRKAKARLELNLAKVIKDNKKGFFKYEESTNELINEELGIAYPIIDGIPNMIPEAARTTRKRPPAEGSEQP
uniref:Uncharacterized protein n=1 Tax=Meleagris gallopavo TaxID=9103 RepID=A0A803Y5L6_MELGA